MQKVDAPAPAVGDDNPILEGLKSLVTAREFVIFLVLLVMVVGLNLYRNTFLTPYNILNMGRQMAQLTIMAIAMTFLLIAQELDLSVGSTYGLCSFGLALLADSQGVDLWVGFVIVMGVAVIIGVFNGVVTTYGRIPSFIVTLGMMGVLRGITLRLSPFPVTRLEHPTFFEVFGGRIPMFGEEVPVQIFWMLLFVVIGAVVLNRTTFGYHVRATGSNRAAAEVSGIRVKRIKIICFVLAAMAAAFAGILQFAHVNSVAPTAGGGVELTVIAAVVIGGTNLFGGEGTVLGAFLGAALLIVMRNGLVQVGGSGELQETFLGIIIIVAVLIHTHVGRRWR